MKTDRQRLLEDILSEQEGPLANADEKKAALAAFRRGRNRRRAIRVGGIAAVLLLGSVTFFFQAGSQNPKSQVRPTYESRAGTKRTPAKTEATHTMTDQQLLASFPPNSCYLAEVDGRKVLIFADASVRRKFIGKP